MPDVSSPRHALAPERRSKRGIQTVYWVIGILLTLTLVGGVVLVVRTNGMVSSVKRFDAKLPSPSKITNAPINGPLTMAIMGSDSRDPSDNAGNSDSLMLVHLPRDRKHVYLISIPRDAWVKIPGKGYGKINSAYTMGGPSLSVSTVNDLLDIELNHVVIVNFEGFIRLTDAIGGAEVDNPDEFKIAGPEGRYFPKGKITLQGEAALAYARERHSLPNGDLDRTRNQRLLVKAIISKALSAGVLTNPAAVNDLFSKAANCVALDKTFTNDRVLGLAASMRIKSGADVRSLMLPIGGFAKSPQGADIDMFDPIQLKEISDAIKADNLDEYYEKHRDDPPLTGRPDRVRTR